MFTSKSVRVAVVGAACLFTLTSATGYGAAFAATASAGKDTTVVISAMSPADEAAIRAHLAALKNSVASADAAAMTALWTEDGRYVDELGNTYTGKADLQKSFTIMMQENGKQAVELSMESVRMPAPNVALVEGSVQKQDGGTLVPVTRYSMALVKQKGEWKIASATETAITAIPAGNPLEPLNWLIGDWAAERNGVKVSMKAEWVPSKNFIFCKYEVNRPGENQQVETQVIGWDPRNRRPISWTFDSSGGFGEGTWLQKNNQWIVDANSVERDGNYTSSTNIYSTTDPNAFSWQSVNRRVNGVPVDDMAPLKIQRLASK